MAEAAEPLMLNSRAHGAATSSGAVLAEPSGSSHRSSLETSAAASPDASSQSTSHSASTATPTGDLVHRPIHPSDLPPLPDGFWVERPPFPDLPSPDEDSVEAAEAEGLAAEQESAPLADEVAEAVARALRRAAQLTASSELLEFGASGGRVCARLARTVECIIALEFDEPAARALQQRMRAQLLHNVKAVCLPADKAMLSPDPSAHRLQQQSFLRWDVVYSYLGLRRCSNLEGALQWLAAHLQPGGRLAIFEIERSPHSHTFQGSSRALHHAEGFASQELVDLFMAAGLTSVEVRRVHEFQLSDGQRPQLVWLFMVLGSAPAPSTHAERKSVSKFGESYTTLS